MIKTAAHEASLNTSLAPIVPTVASEALLSRKTDLEKQLPADNGKTEKIQCKRCLFLQQWDTKIGHARQAR